MPHDLLEEPQLLGDLLPFIGPQIGAQSQSARVGASGELFHFFQEWLKSRRLLGQLFVIPGRGCEGGQRQLVGQVNSGIASGNVDVGGEVEDLRKQNDAVQVDAFAVLQNVGQHGGACGAVTLAK